jgi:hypothetical protein
VEDCAALTRNPTIRMTNRDDEPTREVLNEVRSGVVVEECTSEHKR